MRAVWVVAGTVLALIIAGCGSSRSLRAADPVPAATSPADTPAATRSQKPEPAPVRRTVFEAVNEPFSRVADAKVAVKIRAQVNGVPILDDEVRQACHQFLMEAQRLPEPDRTAKQKEILQRELQGLIDQEIILQDLFGKIAPQRPQYLDKLKEAAAKEFRDRCRMMKAQLAKAGIACASDDDLKKALREQGLSWDFLRRQSERQFMAMEYMRTRIYPKVDRGCGHEQIVEYYELHGNEFEVADSVKWQDIFIDAGKFGNRQEARRRAEEVAAKARAGEDIAKLLRYDDGDSTYRNGEGFGQRRGEIKPLEAEPILFRLHDGEVGPVLELPSGFHVIRLVKRQQAGRRPLDEQTQADIRKRLQREIGEREYKRLLDELKRKATVEISPE